MGNQQSDEIRLGERLGNGSYGEVYKGTWKGRQVAVKKLFDWCFQYRSCNSGRVFDQCKREWDILSQLNHPNIVKYYTVILSETVPPMIVLELCDYDLSRFISEVCKRKVSFQDTVSIMSDVAEGLEYLHSFKPEPIIHRDLGSKNILITVTKNQKQAKITDMGLSKAFPNGAMYATAAVGTPIYRAPETVPRRQPSGGFAQQAYYTEKVDIFSFGAVLLEVIIGRQPMGYLPDPILEDGEVVPEHIRRSEDIYEMGPDHPLNPLVMSCFENVPEKRPSAKELIYFLERFKPEDALTDSRSMLRSNMSLASSVLSSGAFAKPSGSPPSYSPTIKLITEDRYDYNFKVAVLGDPGVGKTSIIKRFLHPETALDPRYAQITLQPGDFFERLQYMGKSVHVHIVDTPGEKKSAFHFVSSVTPMIYRGVNGAVIVFDVADRSSFRSVIEWLKAVHDRSGENTPIVLVGNKTDLEHPSWKISSGEAEAFALQYDLFYIETSAVGLVNIDEIFCILIQKMIDRKNEETFPMEKTSDWIIYQSPMRSLLKTDSPAIFANSLITDRETAQPVPSANIYLGLETSINGNNAGEKKKSWWKSLRC